MAAAIDLATFPAILAIASWATFAGLSEGWRGEVVTTAVVAAVVVLAFVLERLRPERREFQQPDEPLRNDVGHFLAGAELGTVLGVGLSVLAFSRAGAWLAEASGRTPWPSTWPIGAQVVLGLLLADGVSYWQHRWMHHRARLWRFHALHHGIRRLCVLKAARFHVVDFASATLAVYAPLVLLGAGEAMMAWVATLTAVLGVMQHANVRMRSPRWLDAVVCTPSVHWQHHGRSVADSDGNFGTVVMVYDRLLGTWIPPAPRPQVDVGADGVVVPRGLVAQLLAPFRREEPTSPAPA